MKHEKRIHKCLKAISRYTVFFLVVAFPITCCLILFIRIMSDNMGLLLNTENLNVAAKLTFVNVIVLSVLFAVIDMLRRKVTVDRPVRRITEAAEQMTQGDFSVRIKPMKGVGANDKFNEIIHCFNQMATELSGVETLRTDFVANVSHEMKTPLAVMQNFGTLLQTPGLSDEKRMEYAKGVTDGARRMANMMTNMLKLNRLENQQIYPKTAEYDLSEQLCECLLQFEDVWERRNIEIDTELEDGVTVTADQELLTLVWNNLLSNAFKFTDDGGTVSLKLNTTEHHAIVTVADTGCGMSPEVGAHIFDKFYQGDTSHATEGNGLGLALVKRVIDIMQGEIRVESVPGVGTTFTVKIRRE
ncbi:MAG: HAMP domain-containing histidine kinase [Lachnospiraceae bacterium]|nr:HAMP domain-containing histidine kinase [Lachnospiraceae bacterium]